MSTKRKTEKKARRTDEEKLELVSSLVVMDDAMFEAMCESPEFIEEMLQTIFGNPNLRIIYDSVVAQKSIKNLKGRSVRLDAYVLGEEDKVFNIEIQCADNCNHVKRVRYNASVITANNSEPGDEFDDIQDLCVVYITQKDFLKKGLTMYHVQNTIQETHDVVDNGLTEIYVNPENNDGSKVAELMALFNKKELDDNDRKKFPCTYKKFHSLKHDKSEVNHMCEKIEKYAKKYAEEEKIGVCISMCIKFNQSREETISELIQRFNLTEEDAEEYYDEYCDEAVQQ